MEIRIDQGGIEELSLAGALAMQQREAHRHCGGHSGRDVANRHRGDRRGAIGLADSVGDSRVRLPHVIVARLEGEGSGLPRHRDRAPDYLRVDLLERFVAETHPLDHARGVVFDYHVDLRNHRHDEFVSAGLLDIDREAELAVVMLQVVAAVARALVFGSQRLEAAPAYAVAVWCKFDLDHLGAHFAQQPRTGWPGDELGEIQHAVALEHPWIIRHQSNLQSGSGKTTENFGSRYKMCRRLSNQGPPAVPKTTLVDQKLR